MGRRSINTTKSGKYMNPTDQFRKEARKRELKKNKKQRIMVRTAVLKGKDPMKLLEEMEFIDRMEYDPMQPPSLNEKVLREKRKKLKETFDRVFKLYEKERPDYAVDLKKASIDYEKTRSQLQQHYDQVRNAERVQLDQIPLPDAPVDMGVPGVIPLPMEIPLHMPGMPMPMTIMPPPSILKKTSAYGPLLIGPQIPVQIQSQKKKKPAGPPPGPPPELSDSEEEEREMEPADEEYDPERGIVDDLGEVDVEMSTEEALRLESQAKSRRIRFADDDEDEDEEEEEARISDDERRREREERRMRRREKKKRKQEEKEKSKKKVSALQAMMLQMAGQHVPEYEKEGESSSSESSDSSQTSESDDEDRRRRRYAERREDERIRNKEREIARRREEISRLDDRPPGVEDLGDRLSDTETAAMVAARLAEEAELEAESRQLTTGPTKVPPGPPPGLPPNIAGPQGLPPGPPPGAPPMFLRPPPMRGGPPGAPPRLMPPGPPPGRPQGMPPGPPPGLPPNLRSSLMRIPTPMGVPPPRGMIRHPGPPGLLPPSIPPPQGINPNILSAPPSIRPRDGEDGSGPAGPGGQSRVTIQAKPQIKSKMGDVTRFMPMSLKVKRETRDQKGRIRQTNKEEEPRVIGAQVKPQPAPAAQAKTKDDAYDQFMKEMEGLI